MKIGIRIALLAALLVGGIWLWRLLFPGDDALIRRQLRDLAQVASFHSDETPLVKLTNAARLANFFTENTTIDLDLWGYRRVALNGRDEVRQAALGARNAVASMSVSVDNLEVTLGPDAGTASVRFTLTGTTSRNSERQSRQMQVEFRKVDGNWLIRRASTFDYLTP